MVSKAYDNLTMMLMMVSIPVVIVTTQAIMPILTLRPSVVARRSETEDVLKSPFAHCFRFIGAIRGHR